MMHWYKDAKLGLAADREEDVPKLQAMRQWISDNWYPKQYLIAIPNCEDNYLTHYPFRASGFDRHFEKRLNCGSQPGPRHMGRGSLHSGQISSFVDITHVSVIMLLLPSQVVSLHAACSAQ